jgi:lipoate-protein ligase B
MAELVCVDVGRTAYEPTLRLQQQLWKHVASSDRERAYLILVEHDPPVITLGRGSRKEHILASRDQLAAEGIEVYESSRGGDVTYHGPGQLVGYPIIRLDRHGRDMHRYLRDLEEVVIRVLNGLGIKGHRLKRLAGVWVGDLKVAAIGVTVRRWISYHGFSLNVSPNLSHFNLIVPCGINDKRVTSLKQLADTVASVDGLKQAVIESVVGVFGFDGSRWAMREEISACGR